VPSGWVSLPCNEIVGFAKQVVETDAKIANSHFTQTPFLIRLCMKFIGSKAEVVNNASIGDRSST
jgi:hypothetical protein